MKRKALKWAEHGGQARCIAVVLARMLRPVLWLLGLLATIGGTIWAPFALAGEGLARTSGLLATGGPAIEVITGYVTAPGATYTAWTMATGNSNQIRSADSASKAILLSAWGWNQTAGVLRIRSPRLHDAQSAIRLRNPANLCAPRFATYGFEAPQQLLIPQDVLTIEQTGSSTGGQIETGSLLIYYPALPGVAGRFIDGPTLQKQGINILGQEVAITTGTAGGYSGQVAINSTVDTLKANTDYALMGIETDVRVCTIRVQGVDSGNLGVGVPGEYTIPDVQANWFVRLSDSFGYPMIPVFNSANKTAILVDAVAQQSAVSVVATLIMIELPAGAVPAAKIS